MLDLLVRHTNSVFRLISDPLLKIENVIATPHVAGVTQRSYEGIARAIAGNVDRMRAGKVPVYCVNIEHLPR